MMSDDINSKQNIIMLNNFSSSINSHCELKTVFQKPMDFQQQNECSLLEITIPSSIKNLSKFEQSFTFKLNLIFDNKRLLSKLPNMLEQQNKLVFDKKKSGHFENEFEQLFETSPGVKTKEQFIHELGLLNNMIKNWMKWKYLDLYPEANLEEDMNFFPPKILYENGKIKNMVGSIKFRGMLESTFKWLKAHKNLDTIDEIYKTEKSHFFKFTAVYAFINFDRDLHESFGYSKHCYPICAFDDPQSLLTYPTIQQFNDGIATYEFELFVKDNIHVRLNILDETHISSRKSNILRIFPQKISNNDWNIVHYSFSNLMFIPIRQTECNSIELVCEDSKGRLMSYTRGFMSATLIIRPRDNDRFIRFW